MAKLVPQIYNLEGLGEPRESPLHPQCRPGARTDSALGGIVGPRPLRLRPAGRRKLRFCAHLPRGHSGDVGAPNRLVCCPPTPASPRFLRSPAD